MRARIRNRRGSAMTEFALCSTVMILLTIGGTDIGRIFYLGTSLTQAAKAGAQYGAYSSGNAGNTVGIAAAARAAAPGVQMTVTSAKTCICGATGQNIDCSTGTCTTEPKMYVRVTASGTYHAFMPVWGRSPTVPVGATANLRVK